MSEPDRVIDVRYAVARSPAIWLVAIVALSTALRVAVGIARPSPWIMPDELLYAELARGVAEGGVPSVRGATELGWGVVYPLLIAPAWAAFEDPFDAFHATLVLNAFLMSLAALPTYKLARVFAPPRTSLLVAAGAVLVPSMGLTAVVMTENAAYPAFVLALWLIVRCVRAPTIVGQGVAVGAIALLTLTRVQGGVLLAVLLVAAALNGFGLSARERSRYLLRFAPTAILTGVLICVPLLVALLGSGEVGWLGGRSGTLGQVRLGDFLRLLLYQSADLILIVAFVPIFATAVVAGLGLSTGASETQRLFASVAVPTVGAVVIPVAAVSSALQIDGSEDVNERYLFYLVPILLVGLAVWIRSGMPRPLWAYAVVIACVVPVAALPFDRLEIDVSFYAPALAPWVAMPLPDPGRAVIAVIAVLGVGLVLMRARRYEPAPLWLITFTAMAVGGLATMIAHSTHARTAAKAAGGNPTWVSDAVPAGSTVTILWDHRRAGSAPGDARRQEMLARYYELMVLEFFNPEIGTVSRLGKEAFYDNILPARPAQIGRGGIVAVPGGGDLVADYVLSVCELPVEGQRVGVSHDGRLILVRTLGGVRVGQGSRCTS